MGEELFRKKSLDKIKSPESLNDYLRVANPGVWLLLAAVIVLLAGTCIWGIFGTMESTIPAAAVVEQDTAVCRLSPEDFSSVTVGMTVHLDAAEGTVIGTSSADCSCTVRLDRVLADGSYAAEIVTESIHPLSFVFN